MADEDFRLQLSAEIGSDSISRVKSQLDEIQKSAKPITLTGDIGALTKEIGELRSQLKSVSAVKIDANIKTASGSYQHLLDITKKIGNVEIKMAKLDTKANANELEFLTNKLKKYEEEQAKAMKSLDGKYTTEQIDAIINKVLELETRTKDAVDEIKSKLKDKSAIEEQKAAWSGLEKSIKEREQGIAQAYKDLERKAKELSSKMTELGKLKNPLGKNGDEYKEIEAQIADLRRQYDILYNDLQKELNSTQIAHLKDTLAQGEAAVKQFHARMADISSAERQKKALSEINAVLEKTKSLEATTQNATFKDYVGTATIEKYKSSLEDLKTKLESAREKFGELIPADKIAEANSMFDGIKNNLENITSKAEAAREKLIESIQGGLAGGANSDYDVAISKVNLEMTKLSTVSDTTKEKVQLLRDTLTEMKSASESGELDNLIAKEELFSSTLKQVQNELRITADREKELAQAEKITAAEQKLLNDRAILSNQMGVWLKENTAAARMFGEQIKVLQSEVKSCDNVRLGQIRQEFRMITQEAKMAGKTGLAFTDRLGYQIKKLSTYFSGLYIIMSTYRTLKTGVETVIELDTALVDLKKTTDGTTEQLNEFYESASEIGKQLGVTAQSVISSAASWSRLGYSIKDAVEMAKTASIFESISPDLTGEEATNGLVSVMKAFKIEANDALDGIASKINIIGNKTGASNGGIVDALTRSSAAMAEANNSLDETIALAAAGGEITRDFSNMGQVLKTSSMRLRGYDEETQTTSGDVEVLSGKIANLTKVASNNYRGISLFTDDTKSTFKSTLQIYREIANIYDEMTDKNQADNYCLCA